MLNQEVERETIAALKNEFEQFFKENYSRLYYYALRYIPDSEICKDLVSDSFHFMWERIETFRVDTALTYMYTHVQHLCIDYIRRSEMKEANVPSYLSMLQEWNASSILCKVNLKYLLLPQIDRSNKIYYNAVVSLKIDYLLKIGVIVCRLFPPPKQNAARN